MASRTVYFSVFDTSGYPLSGLSLDFSGAGYYRINGVQAGSPPVVSEISSSGTYKFVATLSEGEELAWRIYNGSQASSRYSYGDLWYVDTLVPTSAGDAPTASEIASAVLDEMVAPHGTSGSLGAYIQDLLTGVTSIDSKVSNLPESPASEESVLEARLASELAAKLLKNKINWDVNTAIMTVWDDNGTTPLFQFAFTDETGRPSVVSALNRNPL